MQTNQEIVSEIIRNTTSQKIIDCLRESALPARQILIAVERISKNGLALIEDWIKEALERGCIIELFVGTDYYQSDPSALQSINELFRDYDDTILWLYKTNAKSAFHPKLYFFRGEKNISVIIGSSDLTEGGLIRNKEVCVRLSMPIHSDMAWQSERIFHNYRGDEDICRGSNLDISRYEGEWQRFHKPKKKAEQKAIREIRAIPSMREDNIQSYLKEYLKKPSEQEDYQHRKTKYAQIPSLLDQLIEVRTRKEFMDIYELLVGKAGQGSLWHSGGLFRRKNDVANNFVEVCSMIRTIRDNPSFSPQELFTLAACRREQFFH